MTILMIIAIIIGITIFILNFKKIKYEHFPTEEQKDIAKYMNVVYAESRKCLDKTFSFRTTKWQEFCDTEQRWKKWHCSRKDIQYLKETRTFITEPNIRYFIYIKKLKPHKLKITDLPEIQQNLNDCKKELDEFFNEALKKLQEFQLRDEELFKIHIEKEKKKNSAEWRDYERHQTNQQYSSRFGTDYSSYKKTEDFVKDTERQYIGKYFADCKTVEDAKMVHRKLSKLYHPDSPTGDADKFRLVEEEYNTFINSR